MIVEIDLLNLCVLLHNCRLCFPLDVTGIQLLALSLRYAMLEEALIGPGMEHDVNISVMHPYG